MNSPAFNGFDDLGDDFDSQPIAKGIPETLEAASDGKSIQFKGDFKEKCPRCAGSGRYHRVTEYGTVCLKCKGAGVLYFKTSAADRAKSRKASADSKERKAEKNLAAFEASHPEIAAWWNGENRDFQFAVSLRDWVRKNGKLSDGQLRAALKCIEAVAAKVRAKDERAQHAADIGPVDVSCIVKAIKKASDKGLKNPKIRLMAGAVGIIVYRASAHGNNAGSLYVKSVDGAEYLGKITSNLFYRSRSTSEELETDIVKACSTADVAAVAYGRLTGQCSCCGRELTDPVSIQNGIGPICADKFFG
jgi:hypothetical protein